MKTVSMILTASLAVVGPALVLAGTAADAQGGIDPQCKSMRDKIGCTCAMQTGGRISPDGKSWTYPKGSINAFATCRARGGGKG